MLSFYTLIKKVKSDSVFLVTMIIFLLVCYCRFPYKSMTFHTNCFETERPIVFKAIVRLQPRKYTSIHEDYFEQGIQSPLVLWAVDGRIFAPHSEHDTFPLSKDLSSYFSHHCCHLLRFSPKSSSVK